VSPLVGIAGFAIAGALAAGAAFDGVATYHDGLRPLMPEYRRGEMERADLGRRGWAMSAGFVRWFALPFILVSGVGVSHAVFLPTDIVGLRSARRALALLVGGVVGLLAGALVLVVDFLPADLTNTWLEMAEPLRYLIILLPVVAALEYRGLAAAVLVSLIVVALRITVTISTVGVDPDAMALLGGTLACLIIALRERVPAPERPEVLSHNLYAARRSLIYLTPLGAVVGALAYGGFLAGEPGAALLLGADLRWAAASVAIFSGVAFIPSVTRSVAVSGSASTQGSPDWVLAVGFLAPSYWAAALGGAAALSAEVLGAPLLLRLVDRHPKLSVMGVAMRHALVVVFDLAVLIGGAMVAHALLPGFGLATVVGLFIWNEAKGRPLMPIAVGALGAIAAGIVEYLLETF